MIFTSSEVGHPEIWAGDGMCLSPAQCECRERGVSSTIDVGHLVIDALHPSLRITVPCKTQNHCSCNTVHTVVLPLCLTLSCNGPERRDENSERKHKPLLA